MSGKVRRVIAIVGAGVIALSLQHVGASDASACGLLSNLLGCGSPAQQQPTGLLPTVTDTINDINVDLELPELVAPGIGTVDLPDVDLSGGTATIAGPTVDIDAPLLPSVQVGASSTSIALPGVTVEPSAGDGLPALTLDPGSIDAELPSLAIETSNAPIELPSVALNGGSVSADLPTIGVTPTDGAGLLPGVSIGSGSGAVELPDAEISGSLGPLPLPAIAVNGGGTTVTTPGIWTSPDGPLGLPTVNVGPGGVIVELPGGSVGGDSPAGPPPGNPTGSSNNSPEAPSNGNPPTTQPQPGGNPATPAPGTGNPGNGTPPITQEADDPFSPQAPAAPALPGIAPDGRIERPTGPPASPIAPSSVPTTPAADADPGRDGQYWPPTAAAPVLTVVDNPRGSDDHHPVMGRAPRAIGEVVPGLTAVFSGTAMAGAGSGAPFIACLAVVALLAVLGRELLVLAPAATRPKSCTYQPLIPPA